METPQTETILNPVEVAYDGCPLCKCLYSWCKFEATVKSTGYDDALPRLFRWKICEECGHEYKEKHLTDYGFDLLKKSHLLKQVWPIDEDRFDAERIKFAQIADLVTNGDYIKRHSKDWLDVGFGHGMMMCVAEEYGFKATGIDFRNIAVNNLSSIFSRHNQLVHTTLDEYSPKPGTQFDVISMLDFLEHTVYPNAQLTKAWVMLRPGGKLVISFPNMGSPFWFAGEPQPRSWFYYGEMEHFHNFTVDRMARLLGDSGFRITKVKINMMYKFGITILAEK